MARNGQGVDTGGLDQRIWRWLGRVAFGTALVIIILTLSQCTIKKPEAPEWNTQFVVPAINHTYSMDELIRRIDQEGLGMDSLHNVTYSITEDLDTFYLDASNLTTPNLSYSTSQTLGPVTLDAPSAPPVQVSFDDISGLSTGMGGAVPPTSFSLQNPMPPISTFSSATISSGVIYAVITNDLNMDLDTVNIELIDVGNGFSFGIQSMASGLGTGETDSLAFDLGGHTVSNDLRVDAHCHTPGAVLLSTATSTLSTAVRSDGPLIVTAAAAEVPALSRSFSQQVDLNESSPITNAVLAGGQLQLTVTNNTPLTATLQITFPDINQNGQPLVITRQVAANGSSNITQNLAGYSISPADQTVPQSINVDIQANAAGTTPNLVQIRSTQSFALSAALTNLSFSSVTGTFDALSADIDPVQTNIDVPVGFDSLQLQHATLILEIHNKVELPGDVDITIQGNNGKTLHLAGAVQAGSASGITISALTDTSVADFLTPLPSMITASGSATFGDGLTDGTIRQQDYIFGRVRIVAPLDVIINENSVSTDVEGSRIDQKNIDKITNHVESARFVYDIISHLPLGADFQIYLGGDSATLLTKPDKVVDDITLPAAPVSNSLAIDTVSTGSQIVELTSDEVTNLLTNDTLFSVAVITLHDSNGQPVKLTASDYLKINGRIEVDYHFDGNF